MDPVASYHFSSADIMRMTGVNIGNFAFRHALRYIVDGIDDYVLASYPIYRKAVFDQRDVENTVVSCANWLGTSPHDESSNIDRAQIFGGTGAPTVCFGLGVQAKSGVDVQELGPNTQFLAQTLSRKAPLLSVRDETTRRTLENIGVTNSVVTGCPSNFINGDPTLGDKVARKAEQLLTHVRSWADLRSMVCEFSAGNPASGAVLKHSIRLMEETPAFYILQGPPLLPFTLRETRDLPAAYLSNNPFDGDRERLARVLHSKCLHFSSIEGWMDFSRTCDLSFGMRIHGNMIPLQSGTPSILISHDSRTAGLADIMGIPRISAEDFAEKHAADPRYVLERIVDGMMVYDAKRSVLAETMYDYVTKNGLTPHASLARLAGKTP